jgi:hypothetical protein
MQVHVPIDGMTEPHSVASRENVVFIEALRQLGPDAAGVVVSWQR